MVSYNDTYSIVTKVRLIKYRIILEANNFFSHEFKCNIVKRTKRFTLYG